MENENENENLDLLTRLEVSSWLWEKCSYDSCSKEDIFCIENSLWKPFSESANKIKQERLKNKK